MHRERTIRALMYTIHHILYMHIQKIGIPNGIPLVYKFDMHMKPVPQKKAVFPLSGEYLEKRVYYSVIIFALYGV